MKLIVDISDAQVSRNPGDVIITYSLGSCIGLALYDPAAKVGGMLHFQLPSARIDAGQGRKNPLMYADTGTEHLLAKLTEMGGNKKRMRVKIAGGAQMMNDAKMFNIGRRNYAAIRQVLWKNGMFIDAEDVGGKHARTMTLTMADGTVSIKCSGQVVAL